MNSMLPRHTTSVSQTPYHYQCCQCRSLPAKLGYIEIACRRSKHCWVGGIKLGNFSSVCPRQLFFFKFASFLSIQGVSEPFQCPRTFSSSISGIKTSWRAINIDYPIHAEINNLIVFSAQFGNFDYFAAEKHPKFGNLGIWLLYKKWTTFKVACHVQKSQFAAVWRSEVATLIIVWVQWTNWTCQIS